MNFENRKVSNYTDPIDCVKSSTNEYFLKP